MGKPGKNGEKTRKLFYFVNVEFDYGGRVRYSPLYIRVAGTQADAQKLLRGIPGLKKDLRLKEVHRVLVDMVKRDFGYGDDENWYHAQNRELRLYISECRARAGR